MYALSVGLPGRLKSSVTPLKYAHRSSDRPVNSGPLCTRMLAGAPRSAARPARTSTTWSAVNRESARSASPSRVKTSRTVSTRIFRPSESVSLMKSIAQAWFAPSTAGRPDRT
jgi:hypothetical protein